MKLAVVGSINIDMTVTSERIPLKGETLMGDSISYIPGGKGANQAVAMAKLGAEVEMFGCVGNDENGKKIDVSKDGWYKIICEGRTVWYYFKNGRPYSGQLGKYYINAGRLVTGTFLNYLFDENGILQKNGWKLYEGAWYYTGSTGRFYTGERKINGKTYWFDKYSGEWIR